MAIDKRYFSIDIDELQDHCDCLTEHAAGTLVEAYAVMMEHSNHRSGITFRLDHDGQDGSFKANWSLSVDDRMRRTYPDTTARTEQSALVIALILLPALTPYRAWAMSVIGTRFDYHLVRKDSVPDDYLFLNGTVVTGLEVSGIKYDTSHAEVRKRIKKKINNLDEPGGPGASSGQTYICVVEFSRPAASLVLS
jgi:hypothetical protein